jgi:negative regulator of genetic competence, sporulation and motility
MKLTRGRIFKVSIHNSTEDIENTTLLEYKEMLDLIDLMEDNSILNINADLYELTDCMMYNKLCEDLKSKSLYLEKLYEYFIEIRGPPYYYVAEYVFCVKRLSNTKREIKR